MEKEGQATCLMSRDRPVKLDLKVAHFASVTQQHENYGKVLSHALVATFHVMENK